MSRFFNQVRIAATVFSFSLFLGLAACSGDRDASIVSSKEDGSDHGQISSLSYPVDTVNKVSYTNCELFGVIHNEALDRVYQNVMTSFPTTSYTKSSFTAACSTQVGYHINYVSTATSGHAFTPVAFSLGASTFTVSNFTDTCIGLSVFQKTILNRIDSIMANTPANQYSSAVSAYNAVQSQIDGHGTANDKPGLYAVLAVARYSCQYWSGSSGQNWLDKVNEHGENFVPDYVPQAAINWGAVAREDVKGFIAAVGYAIFTGSFTAATLQGAVVGGLSTGGIGAVPGAIIGAVGSVAASGTAGAAGASALELAVQLIWD